MEHVDALDELYSIERARVYNEVINTLWAQGVLTEEEESMNIKVAHRITDAVLSIKDSSNVNFQDQPQFTVDIKSNAADNTADDFKIYVKLHRRADQHTCWERLAKTLGEVDDVEVYWRPSDDGVVEVRA